MPSDILTRARALLEGITPGKWNYELTEYEAEVYRNNVDYNDKIASVYGEDGKQQCKNTFFIVAAPELVRELCAEVEGLERSLARRTMERDNMTERWDKENDMRHTAEARAEEFYRRESISFRAKLAHKDKLIEALRRVVKAHDEYLWISDWAVGWPVSESLETKLQQAYERRDTARAALEAVEKEI